MWVQPETTQKLYVALWAAFLASCFFPYRLVGLAVGEQARAGVGGAGGRGVARVSDGQALGVVGAVHFHCCPWHLGSTRAPSPGGVPAMRTARIKGQLGTVPQSFPSRHPRGRAQGHVVWGQFYCLS